MPELATNVFAVRLGAPDLAGGDLFGSTRANMLLFALIDLVPPRGRVRKHAAFDHALAASLAISLHALPAAFLLIRPEGSLLSVGPGPVSAARFHWNEGHPGTN